MHYIKKCFSTIHNHKWVDPIGIGVKFLGLFVRYYSSDIYRMEEGGFKGNMHF